MAGLSGFRVICWVCTAVIGISGSSLAAAQEWPVAQPIKVIAPTTAGSTADLMARIVFEQVGRQLEQTVIVENRGGAGTIVGMNAVAKAPPDGYTLLVNSTSYVVVASTYAHLPYDPLTDMTGIALLARFPVVVASSLKYKTLAQLIAAGRIKPSPLTDVPYRGTAEAMNELVAGRLDMYSGVVPNALELAKAEKINILALESAKRSVLFPGVPTTIEAGYPNSDYNFWMGSFLPAKTPDQIVQRLNLEVRKALQLPAIKSKIVLLGGETDAGDGMTVEQFNDFISKERAANAQIVKLIDYQPQ
jgi:tripartite-type tricarboxylate transporter receptor subunit TctC